MVYVLLVIIILLLAISIWYTKDILSPISILCLSYLLAGFCSVINSSLRGWELELHENTIVLIIVSLVLFVFVFIGTYNFLDVKKQKSNDSKNSIRFIPILRVNSFVKRFFLILQLLILIIYIYYFQKNTGIIFDIKSFNRMMNAWKMSSYYATELVRTIPFWVTFITKISRAVTYVYICLFFQGYYADKEIHWEYLLSILLYTPVVLLSSARWNLIVLLLACVFIWYYIYVFYRGTTRTIEWRMYLKMVLIALGICLIFSMTRSVVGRQSTLPFVEYITGHFGFSLQNLDMFMQNPLDKELIWGKETFVSVHRILYQLGIDKVYYTVHLEFRSKNGISTGNVYTGLREYYHDFGYVGVCILMSILAFFFAINYYKLRNRERFSERIIIWHSIILSLLFFHSFSEGFYRTYLSFDYLMLYILILMCLWCVKKIKVVWRK